jgi:phosphopantothenoylcysteine synthetase/decarboxylase
MARPVLIVGGAPRLAVDAVRYLTVRASGGTALGLSQRLAAAGLAVDLLLSPDAAPEATAALRYGDRAALEAGLAGWIGAHPEGVVVMSAAINDYAVERVERVVGGAVHVHAPGDKVPSGADELVIRLRPASKVIDQLRPRFGLTGPIVGFKYEASATVVASAQALQRRIGAAVVVANSLQGTVQALVDGAGVERFPGRAALLDELARRLVALARD